MPVVVDASEYNALYRKTRGIDVEIRKDFRKRLRVAGNIGRDAARTKILSWGVLGGIAPKAGGHSGLRAKLASSMRVGVGARDVTIKQGTAGLTGRNSYSLPRGIDRGVWTHPVFGHPPHVTQLGTRYFTDEIAGKKDVMLEEVGKVLDDIATKIT